LKLAAVTDWLAEAGLRSLALDDIVDGFARRLNEVGVPVARIFAGMNTLHPMVRARSLIWERSIGLATRFEFRHVEIDAPILRESPFAPMVLHGIAERRYDLTSPKPEHEVPLFEELRVAGMTDWLGRVFPFGELSPQIGGWPMPSAVGELWPVCRSPPTRPGGFADTHIAQLRELPCSRWRPRPRPCPWFTKDSWPPISVGIRRPASWRARCSAARCRAWRRCCSSPTCAASPALPIHCRVAT
jgi:adenylate cyclase